MPEVSDAQLLRAQGVPITTLDGREMRIIFDAEAIAILEDTFGSLGHVEEALSAIEEHADTGKAKMFRPLLSIIRAGLSHDPFAASARFDAFLIGEYFTAVMTAMDLSFPKGEMTLPKSPPQMTPVTSDSIGSPSTTSPPSDSAEPINSSGE